ncbi:MAG: curli-like amyloid fiber formation chaperone CsgH [Pseudomonadota bacterium]
MRHWITVLVGLSAAFAAVSASAEIEQEEAAMGTAKALKLERKIREGEVEFRVIGLSESAVEVSYKLDVKGNSTTRHSGRTRLSPGVEATLSRVKVATNGDWCAILEVEQGSDRYTLKDGNCPAA